MIKREMLWLYSTRLLILFRNSWQFGVSVSGGLSVNACVITSKDFCFIPVPFTPSISGDASIDTRKWVLDPFQSANADADSHSRSERGFKAYAFQHLNYPKKCKDPHLTHLKKTLEKIKRRGRVSVLFE